jgi:3-dehydroquinate synthase
MMDSVFTGPDSIISLDRFLKSGNYSRCFILVDTNTNIHCLPVIRQRVEMLETSIIIEIDAGESNKTLYTSEQIVSQLLENNADKNSLLVNLGGGMISDLGGFTASVYKRGIKFINVPTTLMAMVDASIGGKTAVNSAGIKNIIGTFTMPEAVFVNEIFLDTLPSRELRSAYAEIVKHVLLSDRDRWEKMVADPLDFFSRENIHGLITHSVSFKQSVVREDFTDRGKRQMLNFGHTTGHAFESYYMDSLDSLTHGESVAAGLAAELYLSHSVAGLPEQVVNDGVSVLTSLYPDLNIDCTTDELMSFLLADKKNNSGAIAFSLISNIGVPATLYYPGPIAIQEAISFAVGKFRSKRLIHD